MPHLVRSFQRSRYARSWIFLRVFFMSIMMILVVRSSAVATTTTVVAVDNRSPEARTTLSRPTTCTSVEGHCEAPVIFEPTHEWKDILPHQQIPGGLHVRMNLSTGKKEAKLLDTRDDVSINNNIAVVPSSTDAEMIKDEIQPSDEPENMDVNPESTISVDGIVQVLQGLPEPPKISDMDIHEAHAKLDPVEFKRHIVQLWKARQALLRDAIESMQDSASHLQTLIDEIVPVPDRYDNHHVLAQEEKAYLIALEEIEWAVQDLDQAKDFHTLGGFVIIVKILSHSSLPLSIRAYAAWVLGSAIKHYDDAQDWALDLGALEALLSALIQHLPAQSTRGDMYLMQKKCLYALGALVRIHPRAQMMFQKQNGMEILSTYLDEATEIHLKRKIMALSRDLLTEIPPTSSSNTTPLLNLQRAFRSREWCMKLTLEFKYDATTLDYAKQVLETIEVQLPECSFTSQERRGIKSTLEDFHTALSNGNNDEHLVMLKQVHDLIALL